MILRTKNAMIIVTHRGTNKSIKQKLEKGKIEANYPQPNNKFTRFMDHKNKAVWISLGTPNIWNKVFSGMVGERGQAYIVFEVKKSKIKNPSGLKKIFFLSQKVIEEDIILSGNIIKVKYR